MGIRKSFTGKTLTVPKSTVKDIESLSISRIGSGNNSTPLRANDYEYQDLGDRIEVKVKAASGNFLLDYLLKDSPTATPASTSSSSGSTTNIYAGGGGGVGSTKWGAITGNPQDQADLWLVDETITGTWTFDVDTYFYNVIQTGAGGSGAADFGSKYLYGMLDVDTTGMTTGDILIYNSVSGKWEATAGGVGTVSVWGDIGGTLSNQTDLQAALDAKEPTFTHNSAFNKDFSGTGSASTVARSDHNHSGTYEPADSHITKDNVAEIITSTWNFSNKLGVGVSSPNEELEVSAGTSFGEIAIYKNSSSVDAIGRYSFIGKDSSSNLTKYAAIKGEIITNTDGTEKGALDIEVMNGSGVLTTVAQFNGYNLSLTSGTVTAANFIQA